MIIDPYRDGVQIFTDSNITSIKWKNVYEICADIYSRVVVPREDVSGRIIYDQIYELYMDVGGIGIAYKDCLTDMGLTVHGTRYRKIDVILPVRSEHCCKRVERPYDERPIFY